MKHDLIWYRPRNVACNINYDDTIDGTCPVSLEVVNYRRIPVEELKKMVPNKQFVFIIGAERSVTTCLQAMMAEHPAGVAPSMS